MVLKSFLKLIFETVGCSSFFPVWLDLRKLSKCCQKLGFQNMTYKYEFIYPPTKSDFTVMSPCWEGGTHESRCMCRHYKKSLVPLAFPFKGGKPLRKAVFAFLSDYCVAI